MRKFLLILLFFMFHFVSSADDNSTLSEEKETRFLIVRLRWESVRTPCTFALWLLVAALAKIFFNNLRPLTTVFPDSSLLIVIGLILGCILRQIGSKIDFSLDSHAFFLYLLPPIIFDAGYFMPNRALFENIGSIFLFSVVGTVWNTFAIGGSLLLLQYFDVFSLEFDTFEIFIFSALISAVDPVAVIAVFEEIHVNEFLFVNVFGEALFNDGVTVVLYQMFKGFSLIGYENLRPIDYGAGAVSFFVVALGGTVLGILFAFLTALATKYTHSHSVRILSPVFIFVIPYMAYLMAEMLALSSIIAIAVCGMVMKQYVKGNITAAATQSVKYFTKMLAQSSETVIFMFLGLSTIGSAHYWDTWFVVSTLIFILLWRTVGVVIQCYILNKFRKKKFSRIDQFILSYGGLRGAIAFGLAVSIPQSVVAKPMFITTTIVVIYFTVFLQGVTIRPLVHFLKVETQEERAATMTESVYNKYLMYMMSGLEDIAGFQGHYTIVEKFERFNAKVLRPILMRHEIRRDFDASTIVRAYDKITLEDALKISKKSREELTPPTLSRVRRNGIAPEGEEIEAETSKEKGMDTEEFYKMFSDMLERKLREMQAVKELEEGKDEGDIRDDYMKEMQDKEEAENLRQDEIPSGNESFLRQRRSTFSGTRKESTIGHRKRSVPSKRAFIV